MLLVSLARRQGTRHPGRHWVRFGQAAKRIDQPGEVRPSKAAQLAVFEPADDRLIDTAQALELALRKTSALASAEDECADQLESTPGLCVRARRIEQMPRHPDTLTSGPYLPISCICRRGRVPRVMHVDCITPGAGAHGRTISGDLGALRVRPGLRGVMQSSCINRGGSLPLYSGGRRNVGAPAVAGAASRHA